MPLRDQPCFICIARAIYISRAMMVQLHTVNVQSKGACTGSIPVCRKKIILRKLDASFANTDPHLSLLYNSALAAAGSCTE